MVAYDKTGKVISYKRNASGDIYAADDDGNVISENAYKYLSVETVNGREYNVVTKFTPRYMDETGKTTDKDGQAITESNASSL